jgi:hypothetical protein
MRDAVNYAMSYGKENLLTNPSAAAESDESAEIAVERAAGFQSNVAIRRAIERYAMERAKVALAKRGYADIDDTSASKPYDYVCKKSGLTFFVEVKGTQADGRAIILTANEVDHVKKFPDQSILVVIHSAKISGKKKVSVTGGSDVIREGWKIEDGALKAIQYKWSSEAAG